MIEQDRLNITLKLNGNDVVVDWNTQPLTITINGCERPFSEDDIHTILRAINEVRRERWKIMNSREDGSCSTLETSKSG